MAPSRQVIPSLFFVQSEHVELLEDGVHFFEAFVTVVHHVLGVVL